jgi:phospholipase/carboxylesterase
MSMPRAAVLMFVAMLALVASSAFSDSGPSLGERKPAAEAQGGPGRIGARPGRGGGNCAPGEHTLRLDSARTALMRVTPGGGRRGKALVLALHGAGGGSRDGLYAFRGGSSARGLVLVAPASWGGTWSFLRGPDVDLQFIDQALARAFSRCRIDPLRVSVGGFSDGATYALTVGLANGDLFRAVMAFSPGGVLAENAVGKPRIFISHGARDTILLRSRTSDVIVRELRKFGYRVTYRRFQGGHEAPPEISREAVRWLLGR